VGFSAFNWGKTNQKTKWRTFTYSSNNIYNLLIKYDKPIIVAETSSVATGGNKTSWFTQLLSKELESMDKIKAIILFDSISRGADFEIGSGMDKELIIEKYITNNDYFIKEPFLVFK